MSAQSTIPLYPTCKLLGYSILEHRIKLTKQVIEACKLLGYSILEHLKKFFT